MKAILVLVLASALGACATGFPKPQTMTEMHQWYDWQHERGEKLYAALANDFSRIARKEGRAATIAQLAEAGYECQYGEAHEDYPEPMAVCTSSFAGPICSASSAGSRPDCPAASFDFRACSSFSCVFRRS